MVTSILSPCSSLVQKNTMISSNYASAELPPNPWENPRESDISKPKDSQYDLSLAVHCQITSPIQLWGRKPLKACNSSQVITGTLPPCPLPKEETHTCTSLPSPTKFQYDMDGSFVTDKISSQSPGPLRIQ